MILAALLLGCDGLRAENPDPPETEGLGIGFQGARRLSRDELDNTLRDLLGDDTQPASSILPADVIDPFDNELANQGVTSVLVTGLETLAGDVATRFVADPARRDPIVGCVPVSATDAVCLTSFVESFGRLALRRPLTGDEVGTYVDLGLGLAADGDFYEAVEVVVRTLLQHPSFVYRIELGTPAGVPGVFALDDHEVAARLSFLLWGSTPDAALLDEAAAGRLSDPTGVRTAAERLLADDRARDRMDRFHAMWLGYYTLPHPPELTEAFRAETRALLDQVVFDEPAPWVELFTADGTYADDFLAGHYGLPLPGSADPVWVPYDDSGRMGLLSHGAFLSVNAKFGDTSPTLRGKLVRERLLCEVIPPPPPEVNVDEPPTSDDPAACKVDRYAEHRAVGSCKACHDLMDPIGFGLENFDQQGRWRDSDAGAPECIVSGVGDLDGTPFVGAAGLADLLVAGGTLTDCAVVQAYRLAHAHDRGAEDEPTLERLTAAFGPTGRMDELFLALVSDESFLYRREEPVTEVDP